jgi:hypothetical protein
MHVTIFTQGTGRAWPRTLADRLPALGHDVTLLPPGADPPPAALHGIAVYDAPVPPLPRAWNVPVVALLRDGQALPEPDVLAHLAAVIATGQAAAETIRKTDFPADRIHLIEPGVADLPRSPGPTEEGACAILATGDSATVLRAVLRLPDLDWALTLLAGQHENDPPVPPDLTARIARIERRAELFETSWQRTAIFLLAQRDPPPSDDDAESLVDEALARGIPVAVAGCPALQARVPPMAGVATACGEQSALSLALRRVIYDTGLRHATAEAAWAHGRTLPRRDHQVRRFADVLESLS